MTHDLESRLSAKLLLWGRKHFPGQDQAARLDAIRDLMPILQEAINDGFDNGVESATEAVVERVAAGLLIPVEVLN